MSSADAPSNARPAPAGRARRALRVLVGLAAGFALGALLEAALPGSVPVLLVVLAGAALVALVVVGRIDDRRLTEDLSAVGPHAPPPRPPVLDGPPLRGGSVSVFGGLLAWSAVQAGPVGTLGLVVTLVPFGLIVQLLGRAALRRRWDALRAAHPDAGVVLAGFADVGGVTWARWARTAGVRVPERALFVSVLVGDADGLEQRVSHDGALLHRWAWDEVELSRAPDAARNGRAARAGQAVLVLTLLGPAPAPRARAVPARRQRFDVALQVMGDSWGVSTAAVVDASIATLRAAADGRGVEDR